MTPLKPTSSFLSLATRDLIDLVSLKTTFPFKDDVGFEDESENVYEEDFDIEEERTEISVSRYDIPDVFTQKGSQGQSYCDIPDVFTQRISG